MPRLNMVTLKHMCRGLISVLEPVVRKTMLIQKPRPIPMNK